MSRPRLVRADAPLSPGERTSDAAQEEFFTEAGAAERFARLHGDEVRYDHRRGRWLLWQAHRWAPDADAAITRLALEFARTWQRESIELPDHQRREAAIRAAIRLERRDALMSMLKLAADLRPIADAGERWDQNPWLLGTPSGVVNLRTGLLRPGHRDDRITMCTSVPFDPGAISERWNAALQSILVDEKTSTFVQTAIGYSATGDMRSDCWFLAHGDGRNGKGTIYHPVRRALGDYAAELPASIFDARRQGAPYDLAVLPGKRFVVSSESGDSIKIHHDRIKQITGGDPIRAANKYEKSFEFQPVCKLWLAANRKPRVTDDSPAFWARVRLVPFKVSFVGREDRNLRPALENEPEHQTAILAWIVHGATRYAQTGLQSAPSVAAATDAYERECDPLAEFYDEACELAAGAHIGAKDFYQHYKRWADEHSLTDHERLTPTAFGRRVAARFQSEHTRIGRVYFGVARRA
jgi:putative DNA primase/helicase